MDADENPDSQDETAYLLSSPANERRLLDAVDALERGTGASHKIDLNVAGDATGGEGQKVQVQV